jgi:2-polyprenyl-3-methyl-5-hydroxy-6-metoxy-1,4-benzoquinol methylase
MATEQTKEPQYNICLDLRDKKGFARFGLMSNQMWHDDPKRLGIMLARYKFVAKMFSGLGRVLEVGCADAFGSRVVRQEVAHLTAIDFDPLFVNDARNREDGGWPIDFQVHDLLHGCMVPGDFDAAYAIDVLEHIPAAQENRFLTNLKESLKPTGVALLGTPSIESQLYASSPSKAGHVNCKSGETMRETLHRHFHNVFVFAMNDEVIHTGHFRMAHYVFGLAAHPISQASK